MIQNKYLVVVVLVLINLINYMDRFTVAGVLTDIQQYFRIDDKTGGLLQTSFICSYMIFSPLFGYLGDRYSRKRIIMFGVAFWSIVTLASSFVKEHHILLFFLFRALVGVGEASYSTIAATLIADLFVGNKRSTMLAIFYFAIPVGSGLGYIIGISMMKLFGHWTYALRFTPVFGIISVIAFSFIKEPVRGLIEQRNGSAETSTTTQQPVDPNPRILRAIFNQSKSDIGYLLSIPTFILTTLGFTCVCFAVGALSWWAPAFMQSAIHNADKLKIGFVFGLIACLGGLLGVILGYSGSKYFRPKYPNADCWVCAAGVAVGIPCVTLGVALAKTQPTIAWILIFLAITALSTNWSVVVDILLYIIVPQRRSTAQAFQILASHLLGDASSPFIIGAISDWAFSATNDRFKSLSYALYVCPIVLVFGVIFFAFSTRYVVQDESKCKKLMHGSESDNEGSDTSTTEERAASFTQSESNHSLLNQRGVNVDHQRNLA